MIALGRIWRYLVVCWTGCSNCGIICLVGIYHWGWYRGSDLFPIYVITGLKPLMVDIFVATVVAIMQLSISGATGWQH
jgi:hypothetical protein